MLFYMLAVYLKFLFIFLIGFFIINFLFWFRKAVKIKTDFIQWILFPCSFPMVPYFLFILVVVQKSGASFSDLFQRFNILFLVLSHISFMNVQFLFSQVSIFFNNWIYFFRIFSSFEKLLGHILIQCIFKRIDDVVVATNEGVEVQPHWPLGDEIFIPEYYVVELSESSL